jgi:hypothetical protein
VSGDVMRRGRYSWPEVRDWVENLGHQSVVCFSDGERTTAARTSEKRENTYAGSLAAQGETKQLACDDYR